MTPSFATADQAAAYGYALPADQAAALLARASQAIVDAAGFSILTESATVRRGAHYGVISLESIPLVTSVTSLSLVNGDGTLDGVTGYRLDGDGDEARIVLDRDVPGRRCGLFEAVLTHGLSPVPDSLVMLTASVAYRMAATPVAMLAGITSQSVGQVSWSAAGKVSGDGLTESECSRLARIVPLRRAWAVGM